LAAKLAWERPRCLRRPLAMAAISRTDEAFMGRSYNEGVSRQTEMSPEGHNSKCGSKPTLSCSLQFGLKACNPSRTPPTKANCRREGYSPPFTWQLKLDFKNSVRSVRDRHSVLCGSVHGIIKIFPLLGSRHGWPDFPKGRRR
jgi:hypothetical protein